MISERDSTGKDGTALRLMPDLRGDGPAPRGVRRFGARPNKKTGPRPGSL